MADRFEKFTERARRVLTAAQEEAQRFNHNYIGTEHVLLGLLRERDGVAAKVLANLGVELDKVRSAVQFIIGRGDRSVMGEIGLTPRAREIIALAVVEARRLNHHYVGTEHLLLGMVREGEGIAAGVLESLGVNLERVRAETLRVLSQSMPQGSTGGSFRFSTSFGASRPHSDAPLGDSDLAEQRQQKKDMPIEELNLSVRAYGCLKRAGLMTVDQILAKSEDELLALRNFGMKSYVELRARLVEIGVLRSDEADLPSAPLYSAVGGMSPLGEALVESLRETPPRQAGAQPFRQNIALYEEFQSHLNRSVLLPVAFGLLVAFVVGYTAADDSWAKALIYLGASAAALAVGWIAHLLLDSRRIG